MGKEVAHASRVAYRRDGTSQMRGEREFETLIIW
jgi:hypothetical protein